MGRSFEDHRKSTQEVKASRCNSQTIKMFFANIKIEFIGFEIENGTISVNKDNITKVLNARRPNSKKEIQSFLGLTGYYRQFIPQYATIAAPLTDLIKKGVPNKISWNKIHEDSYQSLKEHITKNPILHLPDMNKKFFLRTDGSSSGVGAILMQKFDDQLFPICYASKKLSSAERNYATVEQECLAIIWAVQRFRNYLHGAEFILETDHDSLQYLEKTKFLNARVMRWAMILQQYRFKINVIKGSLNYAADYLSRIE